MNVVQKSVVKTAEITVDAAKTVTHAVVEHLVSNDSDLSEEDRRWKELQRLEKKRRAILKRVEEPFWKTLFHWDGTVLSHLKADSVLWITMSLYIATRVLARKGLPDFVSSLDSGRMGIVGGFLTFFIVFYVNQSHKRFFQLYGHSMACKGRIFDAATLARSCAMPTEQALRLIRYMNAAHAAAYIGLSAVYPAHGCE
jgi:Bestrophin, RFP-TM, chloride channel